MLHSLVDSAFALKTNFLEIFPAEKLQISKKNTTFALELEKRGSVAQLDRATPF